MTDDEDWFPHELLIYKTTIDRINAIKRADPDYDHENDPEWEKPEVRGPVDGDDD